MMLQPQLGRVCRAYNRSAPHTLGTASLVTTAFTTGFVSSLSLANAGGRVGWAAVSDHLGRKNTMHVCSLALPACLLVPQITSAAVSGGLGGGTTPLFLFYGTTFALVTWYGGVLALSAPAAPVTQPEHTHVHAPTRTCTHTHACATQCTCTSTH